jgi:hypothetical protein
LIPEAKRIRAILALFAANSNFDGRIFSGPQRSRASGVCDQSFKQRKRSLSGSRAFSCAVRRQAFDPCADRGDCPRKTLARREPPCSGGYVAALAEIIGATISECRHLSHGSADVYRGSIKHHLAPLRSTLRTASTVANSQGRSVHARRDHATRRGDDRRSRHGRYVGDRNRSRRSPGLVERNHSCHGSPLP